MTAMADVASLISYSNERSPLGSSSIPKSTLLTFRSSTRSIIAARTSSILPEPRLLLPRHRIIRHSIMSPFLVMHASSRREHFGVSVMSGQVRWLEAVLTPLHSSHLLVVNTSITCRYAVFHISFPRYAGRHRSDQRTGSTVIGG